MVMDILAANEGQHRWIPPITHGNKIKKIRPANDQPRAIGWPARGRERPCAVSFPCRRVPRGL